MRGLGARLRGGMHRWFGRRAGGGDADRDRLREEMAWHVEAQAEENRRGGMEPGEARRQARVKFGPVGAIEESWHAARGLPGLANLGTDVRYAVRGLRRSPAFTWVAVVTLLLGIGANVVVFGVLNAVLLRPLPVRAPQELYQVRPHAWASGKLLTTSYPAFEDYRRRTTAFAGMAAVYGYSHAGLSWRGEPAQGVHGDEVTGNYFDLLGVRAELGRYFHAGDVHGPGSAPLVVLSDALWRSRFGGARDVVGTVVELNRHPFTVVGVAPERFHGLERFVWPDYWIPMANEEQVEGWDSLHSRDSVATTVIGRLKPGVTAEQATENLDAIAAELGREYPESEEGRGLRLVHPGLLGDDGVVIHGFVYGVMALALLVLAAACANLASLFAARGADRSRETALRAALGAGRWRLARAALVESLVVAGLGGGAGMALAAGLPVALNRWHAPYGRLEVSVDWRVVLVGLVCTVGSAVVCGLGPVRAAWRGDVGTGMKGGVGAVRQGRRLAAREVLLGVQIAICTLLVVSSLVAVRGMVRLLQAPLGFVPQGVMLADVDLGGVLGGGSGGDVGGAGVPGESALVRMKALLEAARGIPGVTAVGAVSRTPMTGGMHGVPVYRPGTVEFRRRNAVMEPYVFEMSPGYLGAARTRLLRGRDVRWTDTPQTPAVAVVNETFARRMWGARAGVGERFVLNGRLTEVVGVVEDGKYHDLEEAAQAVAYVPLSQSGDTGMVMAVRSGRAENEMAAALTRMVGGVVPGASVAVQSWTETMQGEMFPSQVATLALGVMGLLASMLAVTGIFGTAAYSVSRRMKELGIRVALGARRPAVLRAALGRPAVLLAVGSGVGVLAGALASRVLARMVYLGDSRDPVVVGGAVGMMVMLGVVAAAVPARRALGVDPARLMREE